MAKEFKDKKHKGKILDRIQKLLNVAGGTKYEEEANTAMKMAQNYMKSYGLSLTDVELQKELLEEIVELPLKDHSRMRNPERWARVLSAAVAVVFDCRVYRKCSWDDDFEEASWMVFVGYSSDVEFAKVVFMTLYTATRASACKKFPKGAGKIRLSFMLGVSMRLLERAWEEKEVAKEEPSGRYALIVTSKDDNIRNWQNEKLDLSNDKPRSASVNSEAFKAGTKHANSVDLMNKEKVEKNTGLVIEHKKEG